VPNNNTSNSTLAEYCADLTKFAIPSSCNSVFTWSVVWPVTINASTVNSGGPIIGWGDAPHDVNTFYAYDTAVHMPWGGVLVWVAENANGTKAPFSSQFVCARASDIAAGSHDPATDGVVGGVTVTRGLMALVLAAMVMFLL
jgi:hypothetical protein